MKPQMNADENLAPWRLGGYFPILFLSNPTP